MLAVLFDIMFVAANIQLSVFDAMAATGMVVCSFGAQGLLPLSLNKSLPLTKQRI